jgi:hypothetical protein
LSMVARLAKIELASSSPASACEKRHAAGCYGRLRSNAVPTWERFDEV